MFWALYMYIIFADKIWFSGLLALKGHILGHYVQIWGKLSAGIQF